MLNRDYSQLVHIIRYIINNCITYSNGGGIEEKKTFYVTTITSRFIRLTWEELKKNLNFK